MKNSTARNVQSAPQICRLDKLVIVSNDATAALNITMVYEDDQTREWAREAFERVNKLAGKQPVRPTWWKLSNLSAPRKACRCPFMPGPTHGRRTAIKSMASWWLCWEVLSPGTRDQAALLPTSKRSPARRDWTFWWNNELSPPPSQRL
jgi:hypothetical protein